jgi:AhpD family alkylhydroperoxidase
MPYLQWIEPDAATGPLRDLYARIASARGGVADVHKIQSLNPRAMAAHLEIYRAVLFQPSPLPRPWREAIGIAVSRANACDYCVAHHQAALDGLAPSPEAPPLLLAWAERLTRRPESAGPSDIEQLRALGLGERAILDAILAVAYFNFVNRLVLAAGVVLETGYERTCRSDEAPVADGPLPARPEPSPEPRRPAWFECACRPSVIRRALQYALIVGAVLIGINYGPELLRGEISPSRVFRMAVTVLVPYIVATLASVEAIRHQTGQPPASEL